MPAVERHGPRLMLSRQTSFNQIWHRFVVDDLNPKQPKNQFFSYKRLKDLATRPETDVEPIAFNHAGGMCILDAYRTEKPQQQQRVDQNPNRRVHAQPHGQATFAGHRQSSKKDSLEEQQDDFLADLRQQETRQEELNRRRRLEARRKQEKRQHEQRVGQLKDEAHFYKTERQQDSKSENMAKVEQKMASRLPTRHYKRVSQRPKSTSTDARESDVR